jgi:hypothetical protein
VEKTHLAARSHRAVDAPLERLKQTRRHEEQRHQTQHPEALPALHQRGDVSQHRFARARRQQAEQRVVKIALRDGLVLEEEPRGGGGDEQKGNQPQQQMEGEARGHQRNEPLAEQYPDLVNDPAGGDKCLEQRDTSRKRLADLIV